MEIDTSQPCAAAKRMAVVSGASSGIGKATALQLAAEGWEVVALGRREVAPHEFAAFPTLRYGAADLLLEDPAAALGRVAPDALRNVEALINCAGHDVGGGVPFGVHVPDDWRSVFQLNVEATMSLTQACLPAMLARARGDVIVIGSITARIASPGLAAYSASKHAIRGFAQALRADYGDTGLRVTEIAPGVVRTGFAASRLKGDDGSAATFYDRFAQCLAPEDVARAVSYALSQPPHVCVAEMLLMPTRERR